MTTIKIAISAHITLFIGRLRLGLVSTVFHCRETIYVQIAEPTRSAITITQRTRLIRCRVDAPALPGGGTSESGWVMIWPPEGGIGRKYLPFLCQFDNNRTVELMSTKVVAGMFLRLLRSLIAANSSFFSCQQLFRQRQVPQGSCLILARP